MNGIAWLPDDLVIPLVILKAVLALLAMLVTLVNMDAIWRRPELVVSASRRERMYVIFGLCLLICWSSANQINELTGSEPPAFRLGYEHLLSIGLCLLVIRAMWTTRREDIAVVRPATDAA